MTHIQYGAFLTTAQPPGITESDVFTDAISYAQAAEELGFEDVWLLEHHFTRFGLCGDALTMAAFLLGQTIKINVGTAVVVVPLQHPVRLAERVAMIDHLSDGRLLLGI